jgi:hypothetical protein
MRRERHLIGFSRRLQWIADELRRAMCIPRSGSLVVQNVSGMTPGCFFVPMGKRAAKPVPRRPIE